MKKLTFIFLLSLLVSSSLLAQVSIGLKAGGALSGHTFEGIGMGEGEFVKPTYLGGLFVAFPLSDNFSVQPEVLYANKGSQSSSGFTRYNLHYINIPIMLQYQVLEKLTIEVGPEFGYLLSAGTNNESESFFLGPTFPDFPSFNDQLLVSYRDLDMALNLGVGYALSDRWSVNLRYNLGLRDITDEFEVLFRPANEPGGEPETILYSGPSYNRSLQLSVGYQLF